MTTINFRGLEIDGSAQYERGSFYEPSGWDIDIDTVTLDDASELVEWGIFEDYSEAVSDMAEAAMRLTGKLLPGLEEKLIEDWREDIEVALAEESQAEREDYYED